MASDIYSRLDAYIADHLDGWLAELRVLCAQPSVSAQGLGMADVCGPGQRDATATWAGGRDHADQRSPGGICRGGGDGKTLLFYNHYDVQPPEPLDQWDSPPFEPALRDGKLYARGVSDDKGHIVCRLAALDAVAAVTGALPCRVKFLIEGDEETTSGPLEAFITAERDRLAADACLWEFGGVDAYETPQQYAGMRGVISVELRARTAVLDAHSGLGGSIFPNAAWRLVWALATLKGPDEHIRLPGFYDRVRPPTARDLALLAAMPDPAPDYLERYQLPGFLKGLTGGVRAEAGGDLRADLHHQRTDVRLSGNRRQDGAAR